MTKPARITPGVVMRVFWRLARAYLYYPIVIGLAVWMTVRGVHWGFGLLLLAFVIVNDPLLRIVYRRFRR